MTVGVVFVLAEGALLVSPGIRFRRAFRKSCAAFWQVPGGWAELHGVVIPLPCSCDYEKGVDDTPNDLSVRVKREGRVSQKPLSRRKRASWQHCGGAVFAVGVDARRGRLNREDRGRLVGRYSFGR